MNNEIKSEIKKQIGNNIFFIRKKYGYSREKFAKLIGKTTSMLCRIENGDNFPTIETIIDICDKIKKEHGDLISPNHFFNNIQPFGEITELSLEDKQHLHHALSGIVHIYKDLKILDDKLNDNKK